MVNNITVMILLLASILVILASIQFYTFNKLNKSYSKKLKKLDSLYSKFQTIAIDLSVFSTSFNDTFTDWKNQRNETFKKLTDQLKEAESNLKKITDSRAVSTQSGLKVSEVPLDLPADASTEDIFNKLKDMGLLPSDATLDSSSFHTFRERLDADDDDDDDENESDFRA